MATANIKEVARHAGRLPRHREQRAQPTRHGRPRHPSAGARRHRRARLRPQRLRSSTARRAQPHRRASSSWTWPTRSSPTWSGAPRTGDRGGLAPCSSSATAARTAPGSAATWSCWRSSGSVACSSPRSATARSPSWTGSSSGASRWCWWTGARAGANRCSVAVDDVLGGRLAVEHLLDQGHQRIAFLGGPLTIAPGRRPARGRAPQLCGPRQPADLRVVDDRQPDRRRWAAGRRGAARAAGPRAARPPCSAPTTCSRSACCRS